MGAQPNGSRRRAEMEAWWAFFARVLAFILGTVLLVGQAFFVKPYLPLVLAGIGGLGPVVAHTVAALFVAIRGGSPPPIEEPK